MSMSKSKIKSVSFTQKMLNAVWPYIGGRRGLIAVAIGIVVGGMVMNWSWLVAVGAAPILLMILPCAVMCGLGLCMNMAGGKSCAADRNNSKKDADPRDDPDGSA